MKSKCTHGPWLLTLLPLQSFVPRSMWSNQSIWSSNEKPSLFSSEAFAYMMSSARFLFLQIGPRLLLTNLSLCKRAIVESGFKSLRKNRSMHILETLPSFVSLPNSYHYSVIGWLIDTPCVLPSPVYDCKWLCRMFSIMRYNTHLLCGWDPFLLKAYLCSLDCSIFITKTRCLANSTRLAQMERSRETVFLNWSSVPILEGDV